MNMRVDGDKESGCKEGGDSGASVGVVLCVLEIKRHQPIEIADGGRLG